MYRIPRRNFATSARVYPGFLPFLNTMRKGAKWIPPFLVLMTIGYGISAYRQGQIEEYLTNMEKLHQQDAERRRRAKLLLDAYGDRTSLDELQAAMRVYESQQGNE
ncbi:hypothetical protein NKR23_g4743 [Pleurostoma richardsiae]|uniref:Uncharacterized protein n=1 Tax=Pleurostoma richardsiae TaxID=41990 RepID=A0AA38RFM3_9PEZI|nr:hypothetical protein NKR23_g4743 [Pleurostoma richardsiae]